MMRVDVQSIPPNIYERQDCTTTTSTSLTIAWGGREAVAVGSDKFRRPSCPAVVFHGGRSEQSYGTFLQGTSAVQRH